MGKKKKKKKKKKLNFDLGFIRNYGCQCLFDCSGIGDKKTCNTATVKTWGDVYNYKKKRKT